MRTLYLLSVWLHILAAIVWMGGMAFLVLVVVPWLRKGGRDQAGAFLRETGERFRRVGWWCFGVLLLTGALNLHVRAVGFRELTDGAWLRSSFGLTVMLKLCVFAVVLGVSAWHDFVVGPRAVELLARSPGSPEAERHRALASRMGRVNALLALVLLMLGVFLVRGAPW